MLIKMEGKVWFIYSQRPFYPALGGLQPPEEPPLGLQQQKSKAKTKQAPVGGDISTYMANVIFF